LQKQKAPSHGVNESIGVIQFVACPVEPEGLVEVLAVKDCTLVLQSGEEVPASLSVRVSEVHVRAKASDGNRDSSCSAVFVPGAVVVWQGSSKLMLRGAWPPPDLVIRFTEPAAAAQAVRVLEDAIDAVARSLVIPLLTQPTSPTADDHEPVPRQFHGNVGFLLASAHAIYTPGSQVAAAQAPTFALCFLELYVAASGEPGISYHTLRIYPDKGRTEVLEIITLGKQCVQICFMQGSRSITVRE